MKKILILVLVITCFGLNPAIAQIISNKKTAIIFGKDREKKKKKSAKSKHAKAFQHNSLGKVHVKNKYNKDGLSRKSMN